VICVIYIICVICTEYIEHTYLTERRDFLRRMVMYLKDYSPYPDSSLFVVNLRIQLELIC